MRMLHFILCVAVGAALVTSGQHATAQPALPSLSGMGRPVAASDVEAAIAGMVQRHALSNEQAEKVRTILAEHAKKAEQIEIQRLPLDEAWSRFKSLRDEEISWLSAVLAPEQRRQYLLDVRR